MIRQAVCLLLLAGYAVAYPKVTMIFRDTENFINEVMCCMGIFNTPHYYNDAYKVSAIYLSSHIRNSATLEMGPEQQDIRVTMSEQPPGEGWKVVATANFSEVAQPLQMLRLPLNYTTNTASWFIFEIWYGGTLTYPQYSPFNIRVAPYNTTFNYYILGMDYEYVGVPV